MDYLPWDRYIECLIDRLNKLRKHKRLNIYVTV